MTSHRESSKWRKGQTDMVSIMVDSDDGTGWGGASERTVKFRDDIVVVEFHRIS